MSSRCSAAAPAGATNKVIADELFLSVNTIRNYVQSILTKLDAHSKLEAVAITVRAGITDYPSDPVVRSRRCIARCKRICWHVASGAVQSLVDMDVHGNAGLRSMRRWARGRGGPRTSEEQFRLTFEAAPIGMALVAARRPVHTRQPRAVRHRRLRAPTELGRARRSRRSPIQTISEADLENIGAASAGTIDGYAMEKRYLHHDGHEVWVQLEVVARPQRRRRADSLRRADARHHRAPVRRRDAGCIRGPVRRAGRARQRPHLDLRPVGRLMYASPAYRTVLGFDPAERIGKALLDHFHPDDRPGLKRRGSRCWRTPVTAPRSRSATPMPTDPGGGVRPR